LNNIAFELFLDIVEWFDKDESRQMRNSPSTLQFFWLGRKLFGGRFIRFMSGPKHESDILTGSSTPNRCGNPFERIYIFWNWKRFFLINLVSWLMGILNLVYCYLFLFVSLAVIQAIYIEMFFCKESMSVPFSSFPWILASPESGLEYLPVLWLKVSIYQFCRKQLTKLANLLMHSQCALSEPISSSRKTRKLTVCKFI
jgi:hypothetical protein